MNEVPWFQVSDDNIGIALKGNLLMLAERC